MILVIFTPILSLACQFHNIYVLINVDFSNTIIGRYFINQEKQYVLFQI